MNEANDWVREWCSEKVLFLFVFLFKLFIQDVEEIRFFVFYIISRPCRLKKKLSPCTPFARRKEDRQPCPETEWPHTWTDDDAGRFCFLFLFLSSNARCSFRIKTPRKWSRVASKGEEKSPVFLSFANRCLPLRYGGFFFFSGLHLVSDLIKKIFRVCCANYKRKQPG